MKLVGGQTSTGQQITHLNLPPSALILPQLPAPHPPTTRHFGESAFGNYLKASVFMSISISIGSILAFFTLWWFIREALCAKVKTTKKKIQGSVAKSVDKRLGRLSMANGGTDHKASEEGDEDAEDATHPGSPEPKATGRRTARFRDPKPPGFKTDWALAELDERTARIERSIIRQEKYVARLAQHGVTLPPIGESKQPKASHSSSTTSTKMKRCGSQLSQGAQRLRNTLPGSWRRSEPPQDDVESQTDSLTEELTDDAMDEPHAETAGSKAVAVKVFTREQVESLINQMKEIYLPLINGADDEGQPAHKGAKKDAIPDSPYSNMRRQLLKDAKESLSDVK